jgi:hypothetical protein
LWTGILAKDILNVKYFFVFLSIFIKLFHIYYNQASIWSCQSLKIRYNHDNYKHNKKDLHA